MAEIKTVNKALIPVAGLGTRMLPATKAVPKELLPILDKPLIQYVVEEASYAGIDEIIFITRSGKEAIENHFDSNFELESILTKTNKKDILKKFPKNKLNKISFSSIRQEEPLGLGHAILTAKHTLRKNESFAILLPDEFLLNDNKENDLSRMIKNFKNSGKGQILVEKSKKRDISNYGVVNLENKKLTNFKSQKIIDLIEKPLSSKIPSTYRIIGRYILPYDIIKNLESTVPDKNNEIQLTDAINSLIKSGAQELEAVLSNSNVFDCGSIKGFLGANMLLASKDKELKNYIKSFVFKSPGGGIGRHKGLKIPR